jgi:hypothetical protein
MTSPPSLNVEGDSAVRAVQQLARERVRVVETSEDSPRAAPVPSPSPREPLLAEEIETNFGGLFHLVNLALFLNLYGDFTSPAHPGLPLPFWDFVALLGRKLAGRGVEADPVWPLLARLAGRADDAEPGEGFEPPDEWRVPPEWLVPFKPDGDWLWSARAGRLSLRHPAGFLALDVPRGRTRAESTLARELRTLAANRITPRLRPVGRDLGAGGRTPLARWLERLTGYARARLRRALGVENATALSRLLCERRARVFVTAARVDVMMRLGDLPIQIRYAGLDRDPGWVPSAGRHVAFHFD